MELLIYFFVFVFGAIVGSFLNVIIFRYQTGITIGGRSFCFSCRRELSWRDLFPIVSFALSRGKCRFCYSKISWQYTVVEISTGLLFMLTFWHLGGTDIFLLYTFVDNLSFIYFSELFLGFTALSLLIIIGVYDYKHQIIPNGFAYGFAALALSRVIFLPETFLFVPGIGDLLAGPILAIPFVALWFFSKGKWMGLGDAKLMLGMGWFLGLSQGFAAVVLSFWIGSAVGLILVLQGKFLRSAWSHKKITFQTEIPFAPFLIASFCLVFFFPAIGSAISNLFFWPL